MRILPVKRSHYSPLNQIQIHLMHDGSYPLDQSGTAAHTRRTRARAHAETNARKRARRTRVHTHTHTHTLARVAGARVAALLGHKRVAFPLVELAIHDTQS